MRYFHSLCIRSVEPQFGEASFVVTMCEGQHKRSSAVHVAWKQETAHNQFKFTQYLEYFQHFTAIRQPNRGSGTPAACDLRDTKYSCNGVCCLMGEHMNVISQIPFEKRLSESKVKKWKFQLQHRLNYFRSIRVCLFSVLYSCLLYSNWGQIFYDCTHWLWICTSYNPTSKNLHAVPVP